MHTHTHSRNPTRGRVGAISDVDKIFDLRCKDLFVLGRDEHARDPDKLKTAAKHGHDREEPIHVICRQVEVFCSSAP